MRWKAPVPAGPEGLARRDPPHYGARCFQGHRLQRYGLSGQRPSEDCLFLNVSSRRRKGQQQDFPSYSGFMARLFWWLGPLSRATMAMLCPPGRCLVTINYRLGVSALRLPPISPKKPTASAGNYGHARHGAALPMGKATSKSLVATPANVTILRRERRSFAVSTLMAAAPAQGLFHKGIGEERR